MSTYLIHSCKSIRTILSTHKCVPLLISPKTRPNTNSVRCNHIQHEKHKGVPQWRGIVTRFIPIGICLIAVMQWRAFRKKDGGVASDVEIECYRMLPLNLMSRWFGFLAELNIPEFMRPFLLGMYINFFSVDLKEAQSENLKSYNSLSEFFIRKLKDGARPIDEDCEMVCPCDGTILSVSQTNGDKIEQVKGITYSISSFLGEKIGETQYLQPQKNNSIYQCVIYLAPGNYHRFHSPTNWYPSRRKHFSGELLSVNPFIARRIPGLFCVNERAVYLGEWRHGFFSYAAVGATNVGSIRVYFDKTLKTNASYEKRCSALNLDNVQLSKGEMIGEFRMGSTIVILFEAPKTFSFSVKPGQKVRLGQALGNCTLAKYVDAIEAERSSNLTDTR